MNIGLIGKGFVGDAVFQNLNNKHEFCVYDIDESKRNTPDIKTLTSKAKIIFVALPTPMKKDGSCDLSIIFNIMSELDENYNDNVIILKSTVVPGTCDQILSLYPRLRLVFSPEFLTEANYVQDFKNCNRVILGGDFIDTVKCSEMFKEVFPNKHYLFTNHRTAEMVKYFINNFLSVKVTFANEIKQICDASDISYNEVKNLALFDERIGKSHLMVPGPDGEYGYGGTCFPKDINAMIDYCKRIGVDPQILEASWDKNLKIRNNKDWLTKKGRAVSED